MTLKIVNNSDPGTSDTVGGNDWDQMAALINSTGKPYSYLVYWDGTNFVAKRDSWDLDSSNSDALTVLQYAVDNAGGKGPILVKGSRAKFFSLTGSLSLVDKNVQLFGLNVGGSLNTADTEGIGSGGVIFKKNFATTAPLIDMRNTTFTKHNIANIQLIGNGTASDYGIRVADGREKQPLFSNIWVSGFDTGVEMTKTWHTDINQLNIYNCTSTGLYLSGTGGNAINTLKFYGGRILGSPINLNMQATCNDVQFFGTIIEGKSSGHTCNVRTETNSNHCCFYGCSFEKNGGTTPLIIDEGGNNNLYHGCRFDSDVNYTALQVKSTARNCKFINNYFQSNTGGVVATIQLDSGSLNTIINNNTKSTNTVGTVVLTDNSGGSYIASGNSAIVINDWNIIPSYIETARTKFGFVEDFMFIVGSTSGYSGTFANDCSGTGAIVSTTGPTNANQIGIGRLDTGTTTTGRAANRGGLNNQFNFGIGLARYEIWLRLPTLSDGTDTYAARFGFLDSTSGDATDGVYFEYDQTTSANWRCCTANNSTRTKNTSSIPVDTNYNRLTIIVNPAGTSASFYLNGTELTGASASPITSNIPTTSARQFGICQHIVKSAGTNNRFLDMDLVACSVEFTNKRI